MARILILEDIDGWRDLIRANLPGDSIQCDDAHDIETVQRLLSENTYDLIIADLLLDEREINFFNQFDDIGKLIFTIKQSKLHGKLRPPIIIITIHPVDAQLPELLNAWPGWIWGWHQKEPFNGQAFLRNVQEALETRHLLQEDAQSVGLKIPEKWSLRQILFVLSHMGMAEMRIVIGATIGTIIGIASLAYWFGTKFP
ncbi:MAG: hypothetical protein KDE58_36770 [Caldilineaceae bacterium]|nr:hypothetical protein [Caldilineaceae bacterium]